MKNYAEIARRNLEARQGMVERLQPARRKAREESDRLFALKNGAPERKAAFTQMQELSYIPGFFPTPRAIIDRMIGECGLLSGYSVLEPSAGRGDIAIAAREAGGIVHCIESHYKLAAILRAHGFAVEEQDFLSITPRPEFDFVLMNPPFERLAGVGYQDEAHVKRAFEWLTRRGMLVAIVGASTGARLQGWADNVEALPEGSFKTAARPTGVNTCMVMRCK